MIAWRTLLFFVTASVDSSPDVDNEKLATENNKTKKVRSRKNIVSASVAVGDDSPESDVANGNLATEIDGTTKVRSRKTSVPASVAVDVGSSDVFNKNLATGNNGTTKACIRENGFSSSNDIGKEVKEYDKPIKIHKVVFGNGYSLKFKKEEFLEAGISSINLKIEECDGNKKSILYENKYSI